MTLSRLKALFTRHDDEFLKFDRIEKPAHRRPDLCAFIMLDAAFPDRGGGNRMVVSSGDYEIWLDVDIEAFAEVATSALVRDLVRCGIRYDENNDCLAMFT